MHKNCIIADIDNSVLSLKLWACGLQKYSANGSLHNSRYGTDPQQSCLLKCFQFSFVIVSPRVRVSENPCRDIPLNYIKKNCLVIDLINSHFALLKLFQVWMHIQYTQYNNQRCRCGVGAARETAYSRHKSVSEPAPHFSRGPEPLKMIRFHIRHTTEHKNCPLRFFYFHINTAILQRPFSNLNYRREFFLSQRIAIGPCDCALQGPKIPWAYQLGWSRYRPSFLGPCTHSFKKIPLRC
jgi:hypothetical protein